jgi:hypothetical protein
VKSVIKARQVSDEGIVALRRLAAEVFGTEISLIIGANGSYARREATAGSDVDLFYLLIGKGDLGADRRIIFEEKVKKAGFKLPSENGVFSDTLRTDNLLKNIGGSDDNNTSLTRRMLLLLEGEWLLNENGYSKTRSELLEKYVTEKTPKDKIALFLLNDIIRYWRTICVDYEYKTSDGKRPRGIRLVKLRFSRMFLVFGGIVAVAETFELEFQQKRRRLNELFSMDVITRIENTMGEKAGSVTGLYGEFLAALDNKTTRDNLSSPHFEDTPEFKILRSKGREFKDALLALLKAQYESGHPIHKALVL